MTSSQQFRSSVSVETADALAIARFDRGVNRNAIDQDTLLALTEAARWLADQTEIQVVLLTGAKDIFSAGIDLKDSAKWQNEDAGLLERREVALRGARLCRLWEELPQITIAAIEGLAVGGSVALALACDWRVAARNAQFYLPETRIGLNMGWGAIPRLNSLVGPARAKRAILLGEKLPAATAEQWGLVDMIAENGAALEAALAIAKRVLEQPGALIRMTKEAINATATAHHRLGIYMDADQALVCRESREARGARESFPARNMAPT